MPATNTFDELASAFPFWASLGLVPFVWLAAIMGGWTFLLIPISTWVLFSLLDAIVGHDVTNANPETPEKRLFWHRLITLVWPPVQLLTIFGAIGLMVQGGNLSIPEMLTVAFGIGVLSGTIGIVYAHELMHQSSRAERLLGDVLMTLALYGHFRSEHLLVHHRFVGTPRDPVTARYNESFLAFFPRVLWQCLVSSWNAEADLQARRNRPVWHPTNPFWRYLGFSALWLAIAFAVGGGMGVALFVFQSFIAVWQLELVNYVEHYGLTRRHLGDGRYEPTRPHHSWNVSKLASNRLLINLQRHSDHHTKPARRYPLLQTYSEDEAPQLPHGYPVMTAMAMIPPLWRRRMNPRVRAWRTRFYPDIDDWKAYSSGRHSTPA
ncbi:MAG: alkane 1-monooxygenase [Silicimonas sp.]|nr:alkane 1-monooxygenase [Silicimonas sp.]